LVDSVVVGDKGVGVGIAGAAAEVAAGGPVTEEFVIGEQVMGKNVIEALVTEISVAGAFVVGVPLVGASVTRELVEGEPVSVEGGSVAGEPVAVRSPIDKTGGSVMVAEVGGGKAFVAVVVAESVAPVEVEGESTTGAAPEETAEETTTEVTAEESTIEGMMSFLMVGASRECGEASLEGCTQSTIADVEIEDKTAVAILSAGVEEVAEVAGVRAILNSVVVGAATVLAVEELVFEALAVV
jgi:hypothetical protein